MRINNKKGGIKFNPDSYDPTEDPDRLLQHLIEAQSNNHDDYRGILIDLLRNYFLNGNGFFFLMKITRLEPKNIVLSKYLNLVKSETIFFTKEIYEIIKD